MNTKTKAIHDFLISLGCTLKGDLKKTPKRASDLWQNYLLKGTHANFKKIIGKGIRSNVRDPVILRQIGVHLVCPHHLTVAFGTAHVGYIPNGLLCGLGVLSEVVSACTARLILQEDATQMITDNLVKYLQAKSAIAVIQAVHPCHNIPHARAHQAEMITMATSGDKKGANMLKQLLQQSVHS